MFFVTGCSDKGIIGDEVKNKKELLIYCGITMVRPMSEIAKEFEKTYNCKVVLSQGGSEDLYQSIKRFKVGDMFLPGSPKYLEVHKKDGFFGRSELVGYNQAAIFVKEGNPLHIDNKLSNLLDSKLRAVICDPDTGSIGKNTKSILKKAGIFDKVYKKAVYIATDSRDINQYLISDKCDIAINWKATAFFEDTKDYVDAIDIEERYAQRNALMLTLLTFSKNSDLANKFIDFATSKKGKEYFKRYGF
jgi:molybdate transport system substrate-binding protein